MGGNDWGSLGPAHFSRGPGAIRCTIELVSVEDLFPPSLLLVEALSLFSPLYVEDLLPPSALLVEDFPFH